jgi:hypothetical protein
LKGDCFTRSGDTIEAMTAAVSTGFSVFLIAAIDERKMKF